MPEEVHISKLTVADLDAVDELMMPNTQTVGFLPRVVLEEYLSKGWVLGATTQYGRLIGYLLYGAYRDRFRVAQLCVSEDFRNKGLARQLMETLQSSATTQKVIRLSCRTDFPAHHMWPKLGFTAVDERKGRSAAGHLLTRWRLTLAPDDQLGLFRANVSDKVLDVVIDAQIFFDLDAPDSAATRTSKVLISDLFLDSINIWFTDELLNEISRNPREEERRSSRARTGQFLELRHDPVTYPIQAESLRRILPSGNQSQLSDINHVAKAAASDVGVFVTRDQGLLSKAAQVAELTNLQILSPTELILRLHELSEGRDREPERVSGLSIRWVQLDAATFGAFPLERFLEQGERLHQLRERIDSILASSVRPELEALWIEDKPVALRALVQDSSQKTLTLELGRVAASNEGALLGRFLIADAVYKAIRNNLRMVKFKESALPTRLIQGLSEMGFVRDGDLFTRFCFACHYSPSEALVEITRLSPGAANAYQSMSSIDLERSCSPLISETDQDYFLIPIRQGYALNLFDRQQSAYHLFGGDPDVLFLWSNVYFRAATLHKMLKRPGRILWYASHDPQAIVAVSHLDEVVIDTPRELFRQFRQYGTLEWNDLYKMCEGNISKKLMALKFSHTFPLQRPVRLAEIRNTLNDDGIGLSLQSPSKLPFHTFKKLFELGYPERS